MHSLEGKRIVFTGFRDKDLKKEIEDHGGKVVSDVSGITNVLIIADSTKSKSEKIKKAEKNNIEVLTKSAFIAKYMDKKVKPSFWQALFSSKKPDATPKPITPDADPADVIKIPTSYLIHDNGGRPFQVNLTSNTFAVYRQSQIEEQGPYNKAIIKPTKYVKVFIGRDPKYGKKFDGNSILVQVAAKTYIYIGSEIIKVIINDEITGYKSPIYGSDVAYPYATGKKNVYLFLEDTYIPTSLITNKDPYNQLYGHDNKKLSTKQKKNLETTHKQKYKLSTKVIQNRI
jgi:hypothetical protein